MSISGSMSSALSGLNVAARNAEVISSNIANALTEGYGRRELQLSARRLGGTGQGVQVTGIAREINQILIADRRIAEAGAANLDSRASFLSQLETSFGSPENADSLSGRIASLDSAFLAAAAQPESSTRHSQVFDAAEALTKSFQTISSDIQAARSAADTRIASEVEGINRALVSIAELNRNITSLSSGGRDTSALVDQRQQLIDQIATVIPIREVPRENGKIALFTSGGAVLLEGKPAELGFSSVNLITPDMTQSSGALSGLTINGRAVRTDASGPLVGGSLAANFAIRDDLAPAAQANLDAVARDLVGRFQDPAMDATLATGAPGLFTDLGSAFTSTNEVGLASRLRINAAVDPAAGGALWRLRDGLGAAAQGPIGQSALFSAMQSALNDSRPTASGAFAGSTRSLGSLSAQVLSSVASDRLSYETEAGFAAARASALQSLELEGGVDTDRELQDLLLVEQAYAANAKVIQTADDLIQILLGM
ncbi:flagellar hook-associated protein FlgK [Pseudorhodobacter sp. E13]|uniref:flagellar hook-associated protein FlgK n=1 Tax=Pseudorhodobacter sp. E13 TaxID=2487931 RepID=UPI000F8D2558|nr:flagellar hook-associated protein FlgK [Pseudorhodobacter sp. E13]RUS61025.1 flagellar hook-associated protein FlgK [Pseudorhodobacter sp. E13]